MKLVLKSASGKYEAYGEYNPETKEMVVKKGSRVSRNISEGKTFRGAETIRKTRSLYVVNHVVQEDIVFKSASTAANFITGVSTNGLAVWKNEDGVTLKVILYKMGL